MGAKEKEVTRLERVLAILQTHAWGNGDGEAIANALGGRGRDPRACSIPDFPPLLSRFSTSGTLSCGGVVRFFVVAREKGRAGGRGGGR